MQAAITAASVNPSFSPYMRATIMEGIMNTPSNKITFIGDSITEGTKNGNHPWYEPIIKCFHNKQIINISKGAYTTKLIIKMFKDELVKSKSDLYIIALGTNDIIIETLQSV